MTENANKPSIRFKGFIDAWEQRKLGDTIDFYSGLTYSPSDVVKDDGVLVLRSSNVQEGGIVDEDNIYVRAGAVNSDNVNVGDIIVVVRNGSRSLIGKHAKIKGNMPKTVIGAFMTGLRYKNPDYLNAVLNTSIFEKEIEKDLGATINQITTGAFKKMVFYFPKQHEQLQIGNFFEQLDNLITLHQRKYDKLVNVKKSLLKKMFPSGDERVPKIRFKGFTEAWEQRKAEKLFISYVEKGFPELPVLSATQDKGMVYRDDTGKNIFHNKINEIGYKRVQPGQFVIHLRSFQGGFAHSAILGITSPAYTIFGFKEGEKQCDLYWKYVFSSSEFVRRLETVTYGIRDGRSISYDEFLTMKFIVPKYEEQVKISNILIEIDNLITLHQRKLEKLKNIKKSLLERMFV